MGLELEFEHQINDWLKWSGNLSWVDSDDSRGPEPDEHDSFGEAEWLANLALVGRPADDWVIGAHWNHVGERHGRIESFDGYDLVNLTATWHPAGIRGLSLRFGLRDAFGKGVTHAAFLPPAVERTLDYGGRYWSAQLAWSF